MIKDLTTTFLSPKGAVESAELEKYVLSSYFTTGTPNPIPSSISSLPLSNKTSPLCNGEISRQCGLVSLYNLNETRLPTLTEMNEG